MNTKLHVGNLANSTTEEELQKLFAEYGNVAEVNLGRDRRTQRSLGFAFVTMATRQGAVAAMQALNGKELRARILTVDEALAHSSR